MIPSCTSLSEDFLNRLTLTDFFGSSRTAEETTAPLVGSGGKTIPNVSGLGTWIPPSETGECAAVFQENSNHPTSTAMTAARIPHGKPTELCPFFTRKPSQQECR